MSFADNTFIKLLDTELFKSQNNNLSRSDLILYDSADISNTDLFRLIGILNHLLALNTDFNITREDIKKLNDIFYFLGFKIRLLDEKEINNYEHFGNIVYKEDKKWSIYFNLMNCTDKAMFINFQNHSGFKNLKKVYTYIKGKTELYITFEFADK